MTPADQTTTEETVERKPLLDLSDLVDRRDFIIGPASEKYYLRTDGLSAVQQSRLEFCTDRHDELHRKMVTEGKLSDVEKKEMEAMLAEMVSIALDAPVAIRRQIKGSDARKLMRDFRRALQSDAEREQEQQQWTAMMMLAQSLQNQNMEPDGSSTTES